MSTNLKLYIDFISQPCRSLYIILKQSGVPFDKVLIDLAKGEQLTSEYKKINRFQKVPCITDGDFKLAESGAILRYLASTKRLSESLYSNNIQERAHIDEFLEWHYTLRKEIMNFFYLDWLGPLRSGQPTPAEELANGRRDMEKVFDILEKTWLNSSKYVTGSKITAADIFGVSELQQTTLSKYDVGRNYPKIAEWIENVRQETNPHFDDAHKILYKIAKISK
ncbi:glutathione S-transferase theta-3-like [Episyrphus balteatus]|uniref:glutathione S-transferase theta-3-like n=1 Tax=Episyrphus balteatus TaxID=286459 RepID=UPI0024861A56|nr:glutathione S-transferase theta-3-like [Episyrphus balteatus]